MPAVGTTDRAALAQVLDRCQLGAVSMARTKRAWSSASTDPSGANISASPRRAATSTPHSSARLSAVNSLAYARAHRQAIKAGGLPLPWGCADFVCRGRE